MNGGRRTARARAARLLLALSLVAAGAPGQPLAELGLEPLPDPDLGAMEEAVRNQLRDERARVEALLGRDAPPRARLAEGFGRLGQLYHGYVLRLPAAACYRNAIRLAPDEPRWHYYLGVVHQDEGRAEEALIELATAHELEPNVPALVRRGDIELGLDRPERAAPLYEQALEAHPTSAAAHVGLGRVAMAREQYAAAVERFETALELQPQADRIHYLLGQAHRRLGDLEWARAHLERSGPTRVAYYDPRMVEVQRLSVGAGAALDRGSEARIQGLYDVALREYRSAVEADPRNAVARRALGSILAVTGDEEGAIAQFRVALELDPNRPDALFALGHLLAQRGELVEARRRLERAAELDPRLTAARMSLGALLGAAGEWQLAAERYREVLAVEPGDPDAHLELGKVLVQQGRVSEGLAEFEAALAPDVDLRKQALAHYYWAIAELRRGAEEVGFARLRRALALDPGLDQARLTLGGVLIRRQRFGEAVAELDLLLAGDPTNVEARLAQMSALFFAGELAEALRRLEEGLTVLPESRELKFNLARLLACAPDRRLRDGERAMTLARQLMQQAQAIEHAETLAMALAETGRFDEAVVVQSEVLARARQGANPALAGQLERNLERYRRGASCELGG